MPVQIEHEPNDVYVLRITTGKALALAFAGAGVRRAPVKFFPASELEQARNRLAG
jgi:hypothetical protein